MHLIAIFAIVLAGYGFDLNANDKTAVEDRQEPLVYSKLNN